MSNLYVPKLKYIFCLQRKRSLVPAMSVMRYMNSVGLMPRLLISGKALGEDQHLAVKKELDRYHVKYEEITGLPVDYDIMFSESAGCTPFERRWLEGSRKRGKANVVLINGASSYREFEPGAYHRKFAEEKLIDGLCARIERTVQYQKKFFEPLFLINTGDPDWDWWQTGEFKKKVENVKAKFGDKLLVLCEEYRTHLDKRLGGVPYSEFCIKQAESSGFRVVINVHPDSWKKAPKHLSKYYNRGIHHHVLFKAASHIITSVACTVIGESLFLGTKVGCDLAAFHWPKFGQHTWMDKKTWFDTMPKHIPAEILNLVSTVFSKKDLDEFLSSTEPKGSMVEVDKAFGRIRVPNYSEYLFKTLDKRYAK